MENTIPGRRVDSLGRVVLPAAFRQKLGIHEGDEMDMELEKDSIVLKNFRKYKPEENDNSIKK